MAQVPGKFGKFGARGGAVTPCWEAASLQRLRGGISENPYLEVAGVAAGPKGPSPTPSLGPLESGV